MMPLEAHAADIRCRLFVAFFSSTPFLSRSFSPRVVAKRYFHADVDAEWRDAIFRFLLLLRAHMLSMLRFSSFSLLFVMRRCRLSPCRARFYDVFMIACGDGDDTRCR